MVFAGVAVVLPTEEDEALRIAICTALRRVGFRVINFLDGQAGLEIFQAHQTTVAVVLDLNLGVVSGRETSTQLRLMPLVVNPSDHHRSSQDFRGEPWASTTRSQELDSLFDSSSDACSSDMEDYLN